MKIKYISCDGTEVEEEIVKAEFCESDYGKRLYCERTPENTYYDENSDNTFVVDFDSVEYIKS